MSPKCWRSARLLKSMLVDLVDHLPHELAGLHVVVGVLEHVAHDAAAVACWPATGSSLSAGNSSLLTKVMQRRRR